MSMLESDIEVLLILFSCVSYLFFTAFCVCNDILPRDFDAGRSPADFEFIPTFGDIPLQGRSSHCMETDIK